MSWIDKRKAISLAFYIFATSIAYVAICLTLFSFALVGLKTGHTFNSGILNTYQKYLYFDGIRHIWQAQPDCVQFDPHLLYKPKEGPCQFENAEFSTTLNFDKSGRHGNPIRHNAYKEGIAVIGDSHAMGWGVNDSQTFSAVLEELIKRPVYNLAVSSYGTYRELLRLEKSGLLDRIDTIIIQYCDNDLDENIAAANERKVYEPDSFAKIIESSRDQAIGKWWEWVKFALKQPFREINLASKKVSPEPESFDKHFTAFKKVTELFPWLANKKTIVIYSNAYGSKFTGFTEKSIQELPQLIFLDLGIDRVNYYQIDDHLTPAGHIEIAQKLNGIIKGLSVN